MRSNSPILRASWSRGTTGNGSIPLAAIRDAPIRIAVYENHGVPSVDGRRSGCTAVIGLPTPSLCNATAKTFSDSEYVVSCGPSTLFRRRHWGWQLL